jgi:hypothetical protein
MHTTPWFHSTNLPNVPARNLVQVGIGGWQVPREAVKVARARATPTSSPWRDMERMGIDKTAEMALEMAWDGVDMVYLSFDIDSDRLRVRARHRLARIGRLPAARSAGAGVPGGGRGAFAGWNWSRSRRPMTPPTSPR